MSYGLAGMPALAAGAAVLALLATVLRRQVIPKMDRLRVEIEMGEAMAATAFRRMHLGAVLVNLAQLVPIVGGLLSASLQMK